MIDYDGISYSNDSPTLLSQEGDFAPLSTGRPSTARQAGCALSGPILSNGRATSLVSSLHLWTDILITTSIHMPHA
jgi:hypothetical protein